MDPKANASDATPAIASENTAPNNASTTDKNGNENMDTEKATPKRPPISRALYQLMIAQLLDDGFPAAAQAIVDSTFTPASKSIPRHRLATLVSSALVSEKAFGNAPSTTDMDLSVGLFDDVSVASADDIGEDSFTNLNGSGLDLDDPPKAAKPSPNLETKFVTTHKGVCRVSAFSGDGKLIATGSADMSIKVLEVSKLLSQAARNPSEPGEEHSINRPVVRTFYDHMGAISDIDFHPGGLPILISASKDCTIKFFDLSRHSTKRAYRHIQDTHSIRTLQFHPSGDYVIAGTDHPMIRLYDVQTFVCYTTADPQGCHKAPINQVRFHPEANMFASCAKDGTIKLWDGVTNKCVRNLENRTGVEVSSIRFSRSGQYLLTCGKDLTPRLWEISSGRQVLQYNPKPVDVATAHHNPRIQCVFSFDESYVMGVDETGRSVVVWDAHSTKVVQRLSGHQGMLRWIASSPTTCQVVTCSEDHRARFWAPKDATI